MRHIHPGTLEEAGVAGALALQLRKRVDAAIGTDVGLGNVRRAAVAVDHNGHGLKLVLPAAGMFAFSQRSDGIGLEYQICIIRIA
jgi:hypothetical protein